MSETLIPTYDFRRAFGFPPRETNSTKAAFNIGDQVEKHTGGYRAKGEVRGIFAMKNGEVRYVVEHRAEGGGSFCHIYSEKNLRKVEP